MTSKHITLKKRLWHISQECFWCNKKLTYQIATIDHLLTNETDCVLSCYKCNQERGTYTNLMIQKERLSNNIINKSWNWRRWHRQYKSQRWIMDKWKDIHKERNIIIDWVEYL